MVILMVFCLAQAIYLKLNPGQAALFSPQLFLLVVAFFFLEAAAVYKSGMRTLAGGMVKRFFIALFGLPSFIHFYSELNEKKLRNWLAATFRYFRGAVLFQWSNRPEMMCGLDFSRGLVRLASLTSREVHKSEYWEYYRSLVSLGRGQCLPEERGSVPILAELDVVVRMVGRDSVIKNMADLRDQSWKSLQENISLTVAEYGQWLLKSFAEDLSQEYSSLDKCLADFKKSRCFAIYYKNVNDYNKIVKQLKIFRAGEISLFLDSYSSRVRQYVVEQYLRNKNLFLTSCQK